MLIEDGVQVIYILNYGFFFDSISKPNYYYILGNTLENRIKFQKHKLVKEGFDINKSEHEIMLERNIYRIYDCGNLKYKYSRGLK